MGESSFRIRGMDCAEEVAILKRELGPLVGGADNLAFDLINGKLILNPRGEPPAEADVIRAVAGTGMVAVPWGEHLNQSSHDGGLWAKHGRSILTVASGVLLALGFMVHSLEHNFIDALSGGGAGEHRFPVFSIVFYLSAIVAGGWFIFPKAFYAAKKFRPDMNLLMIVAVLGALAIGEWFEAATVTFLFAVALLLESWSVGRARRAIGALMDLSPGKARCVRSGDGDIEEKPVEEVQVGATVLVRPGEKIPLDGILLKGSTTVNQAPITGESMPVRKKAGDVLFAGTINGDGAIEFETTKPAGDSTLARILKMVEEAQSRRAASEQWVESFARYYTPAMMVLALFIAVVPPLFFGGSWDTWIYQALVILVIACPCALVISTPVSVVAGLSAAARAGVLIKGGIYLEMPARLKVIAVDKTGTLTSGKPEVQQIVPFNGHSTDELLERAASLEASSDHPLARAILRKAEAAGIGFSRAKNFQAIKGKGAEGYLADRLFWIGSHRLLHERAGESPAIHAKALELESAGHSVVVIGSDRHVCGLISVADAIRPECSSAMAELKRSGVRKIVMLTGDNEGTACAVAGASGVDEFKAELLPEDKLHQVEALVAQYGHVAMVGDGVNDAPAMAAATLGVAMGAAGTDAAIETADVALMSDDLGKLAWLVNHSRRTLKIIKQNIAFALSVKALFIGLALAGLATLWMAIAADMGASLLVIFNGLRLLRA